jgi:hypothetical protein
VAAGLALLLVCLTLMVGLTVMLGHSYTLGVGFISEERVLSLFQNQLNDTILNTVAATLCRGTARSNITIHIGIASS